MYHVGIYFEGKNIADLACDNVELTERECIELFIGDKKIAYFTQGHSFVILAECHNKSAEISRFYSY